MPRKPAEPVKTAERSPGRPRKYAEGALVDAALQVMEREGYAALTIRSLAQELGTSHSTLYNYVGHIEDIENQAMQRLTARLPMPQVSSAPELRKQLMAYLLAVLRLLSQHPGVLFPPEGSAAWKTLYEIGEQWVRALAPYAPDEKTTRLALAALVAIVVVRAERDRVYGTPTRGRGRGQKVPLVFQTLEEALDAMMNLVLPGLRR